MISEQLLRDLVVYLEHQPFNQVAGYLSRIKQEWDAKQTAPKSEEVKPDGVA